ncbi:hypothetical protein [Bremerella sp. P1]|uniref:hypothetical protein n=1 Tax=Bremerella sp. P1 TaxID=3026424 RepID=UPI002368946E|nr:hypothetical protein [Bremerella sp. P1]WDI41471.1 hypothetical protein PSR63_23680 [Bremerella sp. P1]
MESGVMPIVCITKSETPIVWASWLFFIGVLVGCSSAPNSDEISRCLDENPPHALLVSDREVINLEASPKGEGKWHVTFDCHEDALSPWVVPANIDSDWQAIVQRVEVADSRVIKLRQPERKKLRTAKEQLGDRRLPRTFAVVTDDSKSIVWRCEGIYHRLKGKDNLRLSAIRCESGYSPLEVMELSAAGQNPPILNGGPKDPIVKYRSLVEQYEQEIASLETSMNERLTVEKEQLTALLHDKSTYATRAGETKVLLYTEPSSGADVVSGVLVDPQDSFSRCVLRGDFHLVPNTTSATANLPHDGWVISFENADPQLSELARKLRNTSTLFYDTESRAIRWSYNRTDSALEPSDESISLTSVNTGVFDMGATFDGIELVSGRASQRFTATLTHWNRDDHSARLVVEVPNEPHKFNVFEGSLNDTPPQHLGLPIRFQQVAMGQMVVSKSQETELFSRSPKNALFFILDHKELPVGKIGSASIELRPIKNNQSIIKPSNDRWNDALQPGLIWKGTSKWKSEASVDVTLRVAENRNGGQYVRLMLERNSDPTQFAVLEGSVQQGAQADGYGFLGFQKGTATHNDTGEYYGVLFSTWEDELAKSFRLTPDGNTLYVITPEGETAAFTRSGNYTPKDSLSTAAFVETWKTALQVGKSWNGEIVNEKQDQKAEVILDIVSFERMGDEVEVKLRIKSMPTSEAIYKGSLDRSDEAINGYALTLKKTKGGVGSSTLLGSHWKDAQIQFRLAPDDKSLVGRSVSYGDFEYLILKE